MNTSNNTVVTTSLENQYEKFCERSFKQLQKLQE